MGGASGGGIDLVTFEGEPVHSSSAVIGVVIPALDEEESLPRLLGDLSGLALENIVVVVDGGSVDGTVAAARAGGALVVRSRMGRGPQLNAGAALLSTPWLLFLHADSRLGGEALRAVEEHVRGGRREAAHFGLLISHPGFHYRLIEGGQRLRERLSGLVYGDQGLLIRRDHFLAVGPYPDEPIMEDVILNRRLRGEGGLVRLPASVSTSARRYEEEGRVRGWLRNVGLMSRFLAGGSPKDLAARYPARRRAEGERVGGSAECGAAAGGTRDGGNREGGYPRGRSDRAILLVFAKAPRPGEVKTRLARSLGRGGAADYDEAAGIYRRMGRMIVDAVADAPATVTVCHDPPDADSEVRDWLGPTVAQYWSQGEGDLGDRMSRMFTRAFEHAGRAAVIGTDTPAVGAETVARALAALDSADVVLGPSRDGGYYLLALREDRPELFAGIEWSTPSVLAATVARARRAGLRVTFLEVESDIDTAADLAAVRAGRDRERHPIS